MKMTTLKHKYTANAIRILLMELYMVLMINASEKTGSGGSPLAMDCSTLSLNMADCLSFLTSGSTAETPQGACCSGLKLELKADAECLCEGLRNTAQFGLTLNITRAVGLPAACHVLAPTVSDCGMNYNLLGRGPAESPRPLTVKPGSSSEDSFTMPAPDFVSPPPPPPSSSFRSIYSHHALLLLFILIVEFY